MVKTINIDKIVINQKATGNQINYLNSLLKHNPFKSYNIHSKTWTNLLGKMVDKWIAMKMIDILKSGKDELVINLFNKKATQKAIKLYYLTK